MKYLVTELVKLSSYWYELENEERPYPDASMSLKDFLAQGWELVLKEKRCLRVPGETVSKLKECNIYILRKPDDADV